MNDFSNWLLEQLHERGWSQADLARVSGLTRATISYYLGPKSKSPNEAALRKIAKAFKIPPESIFRVVGILPQETNNPRTEKIVYKFNMLDDLRKDIAEHLLDGLIEQQEKEQRAKP